MVLLALLMLIGCHQPRDVPRETRESRTFAATGYTVRGEFLAFYDSLGGLDSLGQPLTAEMMVDGWRVQYFEQGRLEYHPENEPAYRVTVGWLGDLLERRRPPIPVSSIPQYNSTRQRYYADTGHTLSGDFLAYFDAHGGSVRFGLPISEPFLWQGRLTQDFQSARFFWLPDQTPPVKLEDTGRLHLETLN